MRVLYFINAGIMGGRERHVQTLVKSLPAAVVPLICAVSGGAATDAMIHDGLNVQVLGGKSGHDPKSLIRFIRLVRAFKPDIIHAHGTAFLPTSAMRLFPHIPLIESLHGPATPADRARSSLRTAIARLLAALPRRPDYYLPVSQATWDGFLRYHPSASGEVLYNSISLAGLPKVGSMSNALHAKKRIIGMVGRMAEVKDWPSFVGISAAVMSQDPTVEAWAIGDGPVRGECERMWLDLARKNQLDPNRLKWLGTRQDARELMAQMSALLITSHSEQLPTTLLEAMALKIPVVGFLPHGGTGEILALAKGTCAMLNAERSVETAAADVLRVLRDEQLRAQMTAEGERIVREHFDMQKICATQLIKIYTQVIKEKKS